MKVISDKTLCYVQNNLTKTQYKYWYDYYIGEMKLQQIALKYGVHITTVSKVLINARKRLNVQYGKGVYNEM